ncbi:MAG TPA: 16S rRNA (adenine(1518)-N(6)/adenine(1519)-N(6))-dimethyltransferase RsmA [Acidobacteriota bacterium]|nr:16S rRNA (adenine(1518)-N(6)/adenine(1519)-N(6))-dimethyltransferase RsmA [Acidobacteriota bacterium]
MSKGRFTKGFDAPAGPRRLKRLGQVFLTSGAAISRIVGSLGLQGGEVVLEIGGGDGRLSERIAPLARRLLVVELDERFVELLRRKFESAENVTVISGDILDESTIEAVRALEPQARMVVYGSLPYYITSPILRWVAGRHGDFSRAHLLVQREVAQRAAASAGGKDYGLLTVMLQRRAEVELGPVIKRGAFRPVPKVDSQLLKLTPRAGVDAAVEERFERFAAALFAKRRKKLRNSVKSYLGGGFPGGLEGACAKAGISLDARPEALSPDLLFSLFRVVEKCKAGPA